jgi:hypothetical protein
MNLPELRGPRIPKRHPACPGKSRCQLPSCIHNAPISRFSADESSVDSYEDDGVRGAYPSVTCVREGVSYQRIDAGSELDANDRENDDEQKAANGTNVFFVQNKIQEISRIILDRIISCFR